MIAAQFFFNLLLFTILFYKKNSVHLEMTPPPQGIITNLHNNNLFIKFSIVRFNLLEQIANMYVLELKLTGKQQLW